MTPSQAAALLTLCSAYDNRKPDADQARAWALVLDGCDYEDAQAAVVRHYRESRDWLMPADVVSGVRAMRVKRWDTYYAEHGFPVPPSRFADDPAAGNEWVAEARERIMRGEVSHPSELEGGTPGELVEHHVSELGEIGQRVPTADYARQAEATRAKLREHRATTPPQPPAGAGRARVEASAEEATA